VWCGLCGVGCVVWVVYRAQAVHFNLEQSYQKEHDDQDKK